MNENDVKENISEAFFNLLMAKNRFKVYSSKSGDDGIDLLIGPLKKYSRKNGENSQVDRGIRLDIQLKCTTEKHIQEKDNGNFSYNLRLKNYEDLISRRDDGDYIKMILILFILPNEEDEWLRIFEDHVKLAKHAFWFYPSSSYSMNRIGVASKKNSTTAIEILRKNRLEVDFISVFNSIYEL